MPMQASKMAPQAQLKDLPCGAGAARIKGAARLRRRERFLKSIVVVVMLKPDVNVDIKLACQYWSQRRAIERVMMIHDVLYIF